MTILFSALFVVHTMVAATATATAATAVEEREGCHNIPLNFDSPFGSYPNLSNITAEERNSFSPIIIYPKWVQSKRKRRKRNNNATTLNHHYVHDKRQANEELASPEQILRKKQHRQTRKNKQPKLVWWRRVLAFAFPKRNNIVRRFGRNIIDNLQQIFVLRSNNEIKLKQWNIGKYDENRDGGMYESELFDDVQNEIDGYSGRRTLHLGMDFGGPVGTKIYAFADGIIHSIGYNPLLGDYGHVIVIEHNWDSIDNDNGNVDSISKSESTITTSIDANIPKKKCWALYGHLDEASILTTNTDTKRTTITKRQKLKQPGDTVKKGEVIGWIGDIDENGGWIHSHLHFQVSIRPPDQPHDMPGASSIRDRNIALNQYFDPRYILGPIY